MMKVEYKAIVHPSTREDTIIPGYTVPTIFSGYTSYQEVRRKACCDDMKTALEEQVIKFGEFEHGINERKTMNIFLCKPYPEGASWEAYPISFCPFCGVEIEAVEVERVKLVPETTERIVKETTYREINTKELKDA